MHWTRALPKTQELTKMGTGLLFDEKFLLHDPGFGHPESKKRLLAIRQYLEKLPWISTLQNFSARSRDPKWITSVHEPAYIERVREASGSGQRYLDSLDVGLSEDSFEVATLAVGGTLVLVDQVMSGRIKNGFALLRPPGHHAEYNAALGFCLFNNIAIAAKYLQSHHGVNKLAIIDWDVHHGNGTQHTFEEDSSVLYVSLHQYPYYPGTGAYYETGRGKGLGATLNCPMSAGAGDAEYKSAFHSIILPKLESFKPEFILISAGFDAHKDDPLAQICLTTECFGWMTARVMEMAGQFAGGRIVSVLEGGYNLEELPRSVAKHLAVLSGVEKT